MPILHTDGSRTYGDRTFKPDPDCESFAFKQYGMATSRAELLYMFSQPGSLDAMARRPGAVVLTSLERYKQGREAFDKWMAETAAFNAAQAARLPQSFSVPSVLPTVANDDEAAPVGLFGLFRKPRKPAPAPV